MAVILLEPVQQSTAAPLTGNRETLSARLTGTVPWAYVVVQGTLYPDVIESCPPPGKGQKHSHTIKSHHNVGGLPEDLQFELIEPLRELFKVGAAPSLLTRCRGTPAFIPG